MIETSEAKRNKAVNHTDSWGKYVQVRGHRHYPGLANARYVLGEAKRPAWLKLNESKWEEA